MFSNCILVFRLIINDFQHIISSFPSKQKKITFVAYFEGTLFIVSMYVDFIVSVLFLMNTFVAKFVRKKVFSRR